MVSKKKNFGFGGGWVGTTQFQVNLELMEFFYIDKTPYYICFVQMRPSAKSTCAHNFQQKLSR